MRSMRDARREALRAMASQGDETAAHDLSLEYGEVAPAVDPPDTDHDFRSPSRGPDEQKAKGNPNPKGS